MVSFKLDLNGLDFVTCIEVEVIDDKVELKLKQEMIPIQSLYFESINVFLIFCKILNVYVS